MTRYTFQSFPATAEAKFDCPSCGKTKRVRKFTAECTVNPFNKRPDGQVRTPSEVRQQSQDDAIRQRDQFMQSPLCATCENALTYTERKPIIATRKAHTDKLTEA